MATYKVVYEIEVEAESHLEAAQTVQGWLQDPDSTGQCYYVEEEGTREIHSVDLSEEEGNQDYRVEEYTPLISPYDNIS